MTGLPFPARFVIGVVHLAPTPGAPGADPASAMDALLEGAARDAAALVEGGVHALIVENFGDRPFHPRRVPPETVAALALGLRVVREAAGALPVGVNVLRNDARAALGLCAATGASFLRVNVHTGAMVTDQGLLEGRAHETLRERARLAPEVAILADVHVKHAAPLAPIPIGVAARDLVERGLADAVIVSGTGTGRPVERADLEAVRRAIGDHPLVVGSGVTAESAAQLLRVADGAIVGTCLKRDGRIDEAVDPARVRSLLNVLER